MLQKTQGFFSAALFPCKKQTRNELRKTNNICTWKNNRNNDAERKQPRKKEAKKGLFLFFISFAVGMAGGSFLSQTKET